MKTASVYMLHVTAIHSHRTTEKRAVSQQVAVNMYAGLEDLCRIGLRTLLILASFQTSSDKCDRY